MFGRRGILASVMALVLSACATAPDMTPVNPQGLSPLVTTPERPDELEGDVIALSFSGGGARAGAFSYGILQQLRDTRRSDSVRLIDRVAFVTSVSGGSYTAAWFGLHGPEGLDGYRAALLDKDWNRHLHKTVWLPNNLKRLKDGGVNGKDRIADWLDREVYEGARLKDFRPDVPVIINAAELYTGTPFAFAGPWGQALCSDLSGVRVADAVAASMGYPLGVRPIPLEVHAGACDLPQWVGRTAKDRTAPVVLRETAKAFEVFHDPKRLRYVHLVDGGVLDNFGLMSLPTLHAAAGTPYGPFLTPREAVRITSLTLIVVNAERGSEPPWGLTQDGPGGAQVLDAITGHFIDTAKRNAYDAYRGHLREWQEELIAWRCALMPDEARAMGAGEGWDCRNLRFTLDLVAFTDLEPERAKALRQIATEVSLPPEDIDAAITAGRDVIRINPEIIRLTAQTADGGEE